MAKNRIGILGPYPPPVGGVSVHIQRLSQYLEEKGIRHIVYDTSKVKEESKSCYVISNMKKWLIKYVLTFPDKILHIHDRDWYLIAALSLSSRIHKTKTLVSFHSFRETPEQFSRLKKCAFYISMKNVSIFIVDGNDDYKKLLKYCKDKKKVYNISPFIAPEIREEDFGKVDEYIWKYIHSKDIVLVGNAFKISFYKDEDLYGIDMCIELIRELKSRYVDKNVGLIFCLPIIGDENYYHKLNKLINQYDLKDQFLFINKNLPLYPIISKASMFVRPTNTDGDSISVREALALGIPTICSDASVRPEQVITFKTRDMEDFIDKVSYVIENYDEEKAKLVKVKQINNAEHILNLYKHICKSIKLKKFNFK